MFYLIYQITNKINGKIYIGKHKTSNIDDGYMGSGTLISRAIKRYGIENFDKKILHQCFSEEEMNSKEAEIVNSEFLLREDVYNLMPGGHGGWDYLNSNPNNHGNSKYMINKTPEEIKAIRLKAGKAAADRYNSLSNKEKEEYRDRSRKNKMDWDLKNPGYFKGEKNPMYGKTHSVETRKRLSENHVGHKNSQYGTCWIYNIEKKKSIKIKEKELQVYMNDGWIKGRKMKFD